MNPQKEARIGLYVAVISMGERQIHLPGIMGDYVTICGLDGADANEHVQQEMSIVEPGERITCLQCWTIWRHIQEYKKSDFTRDLRRSLV